MATNTTFGECLKYMLSTLEISINRLAKAIKVDNSRVNRWIHGKRLPSYDSSYIERITEYLSKNIRNSFQEQQINEIYMKICYNLKPQDSVEEKIRSALSESQGYSIACKRKEKKERADNSVKKEKITNSASRNIPGKSFMVNFSSSEKIIIGVQNVFATIALLLEAAAGKPCRNDGSIFITYMSETETPDFLNENIGKILLTAINMGWRILFLFRLTTNTYRTIKFINFMKPLLKTGKFIPYYLTRYDNYTTGKEIVIVSDIGALSCFSTINHTEINTAFYLKNRIAVNILEDYFNMLIKTKAKPLIRYFTQKNSFEYYSCLTENEEKIGNRFLFNYCFSLLTLPESLYRKLLKRKCASDDEVLSELEFYKNRLKAFVSNIRNYVYKDIYVSDSINNLLKYRRTYLQGINGIELMELDNHDIVEHFQYIINLLETYDNYHIAFISQNTFSISRNEKWCCEVKERNAVLYEIYEPSKKAAEVQLSIDEPVLVKTCYENYCEVWENIAPVNKDKKEIIAWLQCQITSLSQS